MVNININQLLKKNAALSHSITKGVHMKKILILTAFALLLCPVTQSFAASTASSLQGNVGPTLGFDHSNGVELLYGEDTSVSSTTPQGYVAMAKHSGGDKLFGTTTKTNLIVAPTTSKCRGATVAACLGFITGTSALAGDDNGQDNIDGLSGWSNY